MIIVNIIIFINIITIVIIITITIIINIVVTSWCTPQCSNVIVHSRQDIWAVLKTSLQIEIFLTRCRCQNSPQPPVGWLARSLGSPMPQCSMGIFVAVGTRMGSTGSCPRNIAAPSVKATTTKCAAGFTRAQYSPQVRNNNNLYLSGNH